MSSRRETRGISCGGPRAYTHAGYRVGSWVVVVGWARLCLFACKSCCSRRSLKKSRAAPPTRRPDRSVQVRLLASHAAERRQTNIEGSVAVACNLREPPLEEGR